jgi:hypothetical protein
MRWLKRCWRQRSLAIRSEFNHPISGFDDVPFGRLFLASVKVHMHIYLNKIKTRVYFFVVSFYFVSFLNFFHFVAFRFVSFRFLAFDFFFVSFLSFCSALFRFSNPCLQVMSTMHVLRNEGKNSSILTNSRALLDLEA